MNGVATVSRLTTIITATLALICATEIATARDSGHRDTDGSLSVAIVSNGLATYKIPSGPGGLELSSNGPGTITVTSGSNSVTLRGPSVTLSRGAVLAPFSTPGVRVMPNSDGGYIAVLETALSVLFDPEMPESMEDGNKLAKELADADFGDRTKTAGRCVAPSSENLASP
jgi:hypothetical protein